MRRSLAEQTHLVLVNIDQKGSEPLATDLKCTFHITNDSSQRAYQIERRPACEAAVSPTLTLLLAFIPTSGSMRGMRDRFGVTTRDTELQGARYVQAQQTANQR
jgi:hypothetical protein